VKKIACCASSFRVHAEGLDPMACRFCGYAGQYEITMTGLYVDVSVDLPL
jgi:hypothetical protein